ncbi:DMT family transporter [Gynuella sunshinyii]|uniref:Putative permease, DMT superfamily n=1 Tax=Gynuella sunshinyii YC6258 TaxID=1445510 RepID=A0A0C5VLS3_9GAMM|nr:DMT family transporter [Gynuella sunshinyii]AJQ95672.1 putative permease, DMT superfamily [Gynuella sunshinyii YC6258]
MDTHISKSRYLTGAISGLAAVSIWAGWMSATRAGVTTSLSPEDVTALRFGTAGLLLLPVLLKHGLGGDRIRLWQLAILICGAGAPYALVASTGLRWLPAAQGGALIPGVMPLFVGLLSAAIFKEVFSLTRKAGYLLIVLGVLVITGLELMLSDQQRLLGVVLFLNASLMWACYTLVLKRSGLKPLHAAALVSVGSAVFYLPWYFLTSGLQILQAPMADVLFQASFQGIVATILSLFLYGRAITLLGASAGATFGALVPALSALIAIPVLHELPTIVGWAGIFAISAGVYLASGGPLKVIRLRTKITAGAMPE